jgi:ABC-type phosphate/phosphonate transport system substrate-binding protein
MNKDLKAVVGNVLQNNLAVLGAFIVLSSSLPEDQQQKLLQSLDTMKKANQALLDMLNHTNG